MKKLFDLIYIELGRTRHRFFLNWLRNTLSSYMVRMDAARFGTSFTGVSMPYSAIS